MKALPRARQASLIIKEVDDETLVYDVEADKAHCLNTTAAQVWKSCDGKTSVQEIATQMSSTDGAPVDESLVWLALDQLEKFKLLDEAPAKPAMLAGLTRRQMVARLGIAAAALPAIVSVSAPAAADGESCSDDNSSSGNPNDCACGNNHAYCASGYCGFLTWDAQYKVCMPPPW